MAVPGALPSGLGTFLLLRRRRRSVRHGRYAADKGNIHAKHSARRAWRGHDRVRLTGGGPGTAARHRRLLEHGGNHHRRGHFADYADHLAGQYRKSMDFQKSKGWIKDYYILSNGNKRAGEPDLYLVTIFDHVTTPAEDIQREKETNAYL